MKQLALSLVLVAVLGATANADHHHKVWNKFFAGSWKHQESGDQMKIKCVADGVAAIGTGRSASGEAGGWIMGWDPAEKVIVHQWFGTDHGKGRAQNAGVHRTQW